MAFIIKRNILGLKVLTTDIGVNYGAFIGDVNEDRLNAILASFYRKSFPDDYAELIKLADTAVYKTGNSIGYDKEKLSEVINCIPKAVLIYSLVKSMQIPIHNYTLIAYTEQLINNATNTDNLDDSNLSLPYFFELVPRYVIKQLNNNPYSDLDVLDDPKIQWKITIDSFAKRNLLNIFHRAIAEIKYLGV